MDFGCPGASLSSDEDIFRVLSSHSFVMTRCLQVKWPNSKTHEDIFVETLLKFGYGGKYLSDKWKEKPLFIQSFAPTSLIRTSKLIDSPLILLLDNATSVTQDTKQVGFHYPSFVMY